MTEELVVNRHRSLGLVRRALDAGNLAFKDAEIPDWVQLEPGERTLLCLEATGNGFAYQLILYIFESRPDHRYVFHIDRQEGNIDTYVASMQIIIQFSGSRARVSSEWEYNEPMGKDTFDPRFRALQRFAVRDKPPPDLEGGLTYIERVLATLSTVGTA